MIQSLEQGSKVIGSVADGFDIRFSAARQKQFDNGKVPVKGRVTVRIERHTGDLRKIWLSDRSRTAQRAFFLPA